ncbi:uncharacterized protein LOC111138062 isoform X2 [Crassostrea virginica]
MKLCWILFLSVHLSSFVYTQDLALSGQHCDEQNKRGCCINYSLIEEACKHTFRDNCSDEQCKMGYYRFGCQSKCNCSTLQQQCGKFNGCTNLTAEKETLQDDETECGGFHIAISILSILLVISVGVNIFWCCLLSRFRLPI